MTTTWWVPAEITVYRFLKDTAWWSPTSTKPGTGRFDDGVRFTLYIAESPDGAVAEFYRQSPTLLSLQNFASFRVYEIALRVDARCADVRTAPLAAGAKIAFGRLKSNDPDADVRYFECRELASEVENDGGAGIASPSAALVGPGCWNLALFGEAGPDWNVVSTREVPRPIIDPARVVVLRPSP
jgi:RES domain